MTIVVLPLLLLLAGQTPQPAPQDPAPLLVRVTTQVVEVTMVATRKNDETAGDLTASDIRVWDNGKEQTIKSFERLSSKVGHVKDLPAGVFSNRFAERPQISSIILLDALNTSWADTASARGEVIRTLAQIRPEERIAIFILGDGLRVLHDFSSDSASLLSKLKIAGSPGGPDRAPSTVWPFSAAFSYADLLHRPARVKHFETPGIRIY
jgi:VWFA-related protein